MEALLTLNTNTSSTTRFVVQVVKSKSVLICCEDRVGNSLPAILLAADVGIESDDPFHTSTTILPDWSAIIDQESIIHP